MPMGPKSQDPGSLCTVLMLNKEGLFIPCAALVFENGKGGYCEAHFTAKRVREKHLSMGWEVLMQSNRQLGLLFWDEKSVL